VIYQATVHLENCQRKYYLIKYPLQAKTRWLLDVKYTE